MRVDPRLSGVSVALAVGDSWYREVDLQLPLLAHLRLGSCSITDVHMPRWSADRTDTEGRA